MARPNDPLLRSAAGVLLGYVILASLIVVGWIAAQSIWSMDDLFLPGRFVPSPLFIAVQLGMMVFAAISGRISQAAALPVTEARASPGGPSGSF